MLEPLRTAAILMGMCSLLSACGERLEERSSAPSSATSRKLLRAGQGGGVAGRYIVVFEDSGEHSLRASPLEVRKASDALVRTYGGSVRRVFSSALKGYSASMTEAEALRLSADPGVRSVEEERTFTVSTGGVQSFPTWGLDRVDQRNNAPDNRYRYEDTAAGVHLYVLDTGILETHTEFAGRLGDSFDAIGDGHGSTDCHGHGTHVAGTAAGTTYGVAKQATVHAVRVLDCTGNGTTEQVLAGIDWVTAHHEPLSVANMSLTGELTPSVDAAVSQSIAAGITYVVGAGNDAWDACGNSPAHVPEALTVGAVNSYDEVSYFSNFGACLDLFAPGEDIISAWATSPTATNTLSGTSMATPHAAGAAAIYLALHPTARPAQVTRELTARATREVLAGADGSPNLLLHSACMGSMDAVAPQVLLTAPAEDSKLTGTVMLTATASDNVAVTRVEFFAGGQWVGSDTSAPYSVTWNSVDADNGPIVIMARAFDSGCNSEDSAAGATVQNTGKAAYEAALGTAACLEQSSQCDSGKLLEGRGAVGPELNTPNTLSSSCADGSEGFYQVDPSLESIKVFREDGTLLAGGKQVRIDVSVFAGFEANLERLELYSAPDALAPVWTHLATLAPADFGPNVLTATIALPNGTLQALRGVYRYGGPVSACPGGSMDDVDDLVFATAQETDTQPPTAVLTAPAAGATLSKTVNLAATASDNFGVTRVDFYEGSTLLGSDSLAPYTLSWDTRTVANGGHALSVRAYDAAGFEGRSAAVNVTVNNDTTPPTVAFTAPAAGATLTGTFTVTATASDDVGVVRVELWEGATKMNTDTLAPYSFIWSTRQVPNGTHTLTLKAYDLAGNVASVDRTVTTNNDITAPTVALTAPGPGATLSGTAITLSASASDNVGVTKVEFYAGSAMVGSDTSAPYSFTLNTRTVVNGPRALTVKAFDAAANFTVSAPVSVTFDNDVTVPTCSVTSPASGSTVSGTVPFTATASDDRGTVTKVEFYVGSTLLGTATTAPYSVSWDTSKVATGSYTLKVRAFDPALNTAYSNTVQVTVRR